MSSDKSSPSKNSPQQEAVIQKHKTIRLFMVILVAGGLALFGMKSITSGLDMGGKGEVDVSIKEGKFKFSLDKPIVEQAKTEVKAVKSEKESFEITTGEIDGDYIDALAKDHNLSSSSFSGNNLINQEAGYVLTVMNPNRWQVAYNSLGLSDPTYAINTISRTDGNQLMINREKLGYAMNIEEYVLSSVDELLNSGVIVSYPYISYDHASNTAFLTFTNHYTSGQSYMKVVMKNRMVYHATASYNQYLTDFNVQQELIDMVSSFTLIS